VNAIISNIVLTLREAAGPPSDWSGMFMGMIMMVVMVSMIGMVIPNEE